ncbi:MAG: ThiF family adenylyltransferase [Cellvibrionaceae bacterium]
MPKFTDSEKIVEYLVEGGFSVSEVTGEFVTVELDIGGASVHIQGRYRDDFPASVPMFYLLNRSSYGRLAHVGWRNKFEDVSGDIGLICNGVTISRSVNFDSPEQVFQYGLEAAISTISECLLSDEKNTEQILSEFSGHWAFSCGQRTGADIAIIDTDEKILPLRVYGTSGGRRLYCMPDMPINDHYPLPMGRSGKGVDHKGLYIPLSCPIFPPSVAENLYSWWKSEVLTSLDQVIIDQIREYLHKSTHKAKKFSVVLSVPTQVDGEFSWVGIDFSNHVKSVPPLLAASVQGEWKLTPFDIQLHNREYLLPRGGVADDISLDSLLVIGCGSVGGEILRLLGHAGIGRLDLMDYDRLSTDNIYRHILPSNYIGDKKTAGLAKELEYKFPYLDVEVYDNHPNLHSLANDPNLGKILSRYDGVIVATGDATHERFFNNKLMEIERRPWVIYSWLEGYGVGGHMVYVHPNSSGCLSCLYRDPINNEPSLKNIQNFMSIDQSFAKDISGCGTHYLPFSYVDVVQTAILAARTAGDALSGRLNSSRRDSWKGNSRNADEAGLELTRRFRSFSANGPIELKWDDCPVCGDL